MAKAAKEDLELINKFTRKDMTADEVYVFPIVLCSNRIDRDNEKFDDEALEKLIREGLRMPGAMCGLWGVCGAVTSIGAALSIIDGTGPLSVDGTWGNHMRFTSAALSDLGEINGPRCCKRDAMIAFKNGIEYVNEHYSVKLEYEEQECEFYLQNH